jgi:hypothetical protein
MNLHQVFLSNSALQGETIPDSEVESAISGDWKKLTKFPWFFSKMSVYYMYACYYRDFARKEFASVWASTVSTEQL